MKGKLIVIEGLDGSGKATQTKLLSKKLQENGFKVAAISFPDYNQASSSLVRMYLNSEFGNKPEDVNAYAASSFYAVDRFASFIRFWKKQYEGGYVIVADRYTTSNAIYQLSKISCEDWEQYIAWLIDYEYAKLELPKPDITFYLDVPVEISQELMLSRYNGEETRKDLHEKNLKFLKNCKKAAAFSAGKMGWKLINCFKEDKMRGKEDISNELFFEILKRF